ncbi:MAG: superoxide dismutase [Cytophagales bacterium]|nr:MAG: superoxide dismutase [Cytophagales bacterium]
MKRRSFISQSLLASGLIFNAPSYALALNLRSNYKIDLPPLPYEYDALEPYIDKLTMQIHHTKHHTAYIKNLNKELEANAQLQGKSIEQICESVGKFNVAVRNNAGGHYNHSLFWKLLSPIKTTPSEQLLKAIQKDFGSLEQMKLALNDTAKSRFGSGWAWLIYRQGKLSVCSTPNQDNPLMDISECKGYPLIAIDVWEHAYYLQYQNKRADYIDAFWNIINWQEVNNRYSLAIK